jgi:hypothetical protein
MTFLEAVTQLIHQFCNLRPRKFHGIYTNEMGYVVIEIDEIETDSPVLCAGDSDLAAAWPKRLQRESEEGQIFILELASP